MTSFHPLSIYMDARRVTRGTPEMVAVRQQERLSELVRFARTHSHFYAEKYRGLPETITDVSLLPPVTKVELMEHFDDVVTDPLVRKEDVYRHISDLGNIGNVPEGMADSLLVGVNPVYGLYASIVGPLVGALFSSTQLMYEAERVVLQSTTEAVTDAQEWLVEQRPIESCFTDK